MFKELRNNLRELEKKEKEKTMILNQIFDEVVERMKYDPFCQALILTLKERVEKELLADNQIIDWNTEVCGCSYRKEFLAWVEVIFTETLEAVAGEDNSYAYSQATQTAETLRLIFERETGERYPKLEIVAMGSIRVVKIPVGEAPEDIKKAWLLCESLPCYPILGISEDEHEILSRKPVQRPRMTVGVRHDKALEVLEKVAPEAAAWWRSNGFPKPGESFLFGEDEVQILSGVKRQVVHRFVGVAELGVGAADNGIN